VRKSGLFEEITISSQPIFNGRAFNVRVDTIINANGEKTTREIVEHADCIAAVPVDVNGDIWLVKQHRIAVGKFMLEIPAGGIEAGEDAVEAVKRELQEEIGFLPRKITKLSGVYSSPGFCTEFLYIYLATELQPSRLTAEDTAAIEAIRIKPAQIMELIHAGEICDSKTITGLLLYLNSKASAV
jgi:ADP-ribose pyrophosphatase